MNTTNKKKLDTGEQIILTPGAQVIVTGKSVSSETAKTIIEFIQSHSISNWCHPDGRIGHLDSVKTDTTFQKMCDEFHAVAAKFTFLELAITFMNNVAGSYNKPIVTYKMYSGKIRRDNTGTAHFGHPPPKRSPTT